MSESVVRKRIVTASKAPVMKSASTTGLLSLPSQMSTPVSSLSGYTFLIYGERKIGKTTLAAQFEDPFFLMFEPGGRALEIKQRPVNTWKEFLTYIYLLEQNPHYCKTVVIDTGFMCYERCYEYCLNKYGVQDPRDEAWGNVWKMIDKEFRDAHTRLFNLPFGVIITAHAEVKEFRRADKSVYDKVVTQLGKQASRLYAGIVDVIAYYCYSHNGERQLVIDGSEDLDAGTRTSGFFRYTDGSRIVRFNAGTSEIETYRILNDAFYNKLTRPKEESKAVHAVKKLVRV